ncbi:hypothetical protein [Limnohabitans sp. Jir72]|uniref:hypothetical protein n=1 Tax=Limnohabitans sp. Jir72 TaxID=1977909 RepID=UPI000D3DCA4B|nr:hypothetical protein [Limnohabitans sp. Jir72]PUE35773.1 hypothetical protein B9Z52_00915 [Limnohabitans sp. Jir72]
MMLNKIPANTSLQSVLTYLVTSTKWGARNRALFAVRQQLRIKDIAQLTVSSVVNLDASIRRFVLAPDCTRFELSEATQAEVRRYLIARFDIGGDTLEPLLALDLDVSLFPTQKRCQFSPNTLAQHFSHLAKLIHQRFNATGRSRSAQNRSVSSTIPETVIGLTLSKLLTSLGVSQEYSP